VNRNSSRPAGRPGNVGLVNAVRRIHERIVEIDKLIATDYSQEYPQVGNTVSVKLPHYKNFHPLVHFSYHGSNVHSGGKTSKGEK